MRSIIQVFLLLVVIAPSRAATLEAFVAIHAPLECEVASLSPDGRSLAFISRTKTGASVRILDVDAAKMNATIALSEEAEFGGLHNQIFWVSATRLVVQVDLRGIAAVDADGKNLTRLVDWEDRIWYEEPIIGDGRGTPRRVRVVGLPAAEPDFAYVEGNWLQRYVVCKVRLATGKAEPVWDAFVDGDVIYDEAGAARVRNVSFQKPGGFDLRVMEGKTTRWVPLDRIAGTEQAPEFAITAGNIHGPRSSPLGFGRDSHVLYFASNVGRDTFGVYALDLRTGRRTGFALEHPALDLGQPFSSLAVETGLVRDRKSGAVVGARFVGQQSGAVWADEELRAVQKKIEGLAPNFGVRIENWDDARERFLVRLSNRADPGYFAIYDRTQDKLRRYLARAPAVDALPRPYSTAWFFKRADGTVLNGSLTLPAEPHGKPTPVVVFMRDGMWGRMPVDYAPEARAFAQMGYAVLEVAHRGILGMGLRHWEAGRGKMDAVLAEDVFTALDQIAPAAGLERGKVALVGARFGGTAALRLAQMMPERVACVVAEGSLFDVHAAVNEAESRVASVQRSREVQRAFFGPIDQRLKEWSPAAFAAQVRAPVMFVTLSNRPSVLSDDPALDAIKKMKAAGNPPVVLKESPDKSRMEMNGRISAATEKFLAKHLPLTRP